MVNYTIDYGPIGKLEVKNGPCYNSFVHNPPRAKAVIVHNRIPISIEVKTVRKYFKYLQSAFPMSDAQRMRVNVRWKCVNG